MAADLALERASWLLESSGDAGIITDPVGTIQYVNPAFEALTGYDRQQALGRTPAILKSGRQPDEFYRLMWATLHAGREFRGVLLNRRRDGSLFHEEKTIRPLFDEQGDISHFMSCGRDVSQRVAAQEKLRHEATHDWLTGLPNRSLFLDRLQQALSHAQRSAERVAVALIDLNGFKAINDEHGHRAGDAALRAIAQRLPGCLRQSDTAARLGGDEFALLLHDANDVERVMEAVLQSCSAPFSWAQGGPMPLSISAGVACSPEDGEAVLTLLHRADEAMYRAKLSDGPRSRWRRAQPQTQAVAAAPQDREQDSVEALLERELRAVRRKLRPGDVIYRAGEKFREVHLLRVGLCKQFSLSAEGHEDLVAMLFKGDWLGFDGMADGRHSCSAVAADVGELLTVCYEALLRAGARHPALLRAMHAAFARQNAREREAMSTIHALPAAGRVAAFLCRWADKLEHCGMRNDQILLPTSRAEIGGHVGLRLESVSRAMTNLEREQLIRFNSPSRRNIEIPSLNALRRYVHSFADGYR